MSENELMDSLLAVADPMAMLGSGPYRDDKTVPFNNLTPRERRTLISGAGVLFPSDNRDTQNQLLRYILEAEAASRKGSTSKAAKVHQNMRIFMGTRGVKFMSEVDEMPTAEIEATEEVTPVNGEAAPKTKKFAKKVVAAPKKTAAKKAAPAKKAAKKKSAKGEALEAANAARIARLAAKKSSGGGGTRISNQTTALVKLLKTPAETELSKQAFAIITTLKENDRKLTLEVLLAKLEKVVETKQPIIRIWAHYQKPLTDAGYISITKME